jgi:hypothetical protein
VDTSIFRTEFNYGMDRFDQEFKDRVAWLMANYFPSLNGDLITSSDNWIINQINNGGIGLPISVEEALYARGKDRVIQTGLAAESQALSSFAARGFTLPQGVLVAQLNATRLSTAQNLGKLATDVLVENTKIQVETTKFAVQMAVQLRLGLLNALVAFINAAADVPKGAVQYAQLFTDAKRGIADAIVGYYNAMIREQELKMKGEESQLQLEFGDLNSFRNGFANDISGYGSRVAAAATAVGTVAGSALQSINTIASVGVEGSDTA